MLDAKALSAFCEYTVLPIINDCNDLVDKLNKSGVKVNDVLRSSVRLYIIDRIFNCVVSLTTVGIVCFTVLRCLNTLK